VEKKTRPELEIKEKKCEGWKAAKVGTSSLLSLRRLAKKIKFQPRESQKCAALEQVQKSIGRPQEKHTFRLNYLPSVRARREAKK